MAEVLTTISPITNAPIHQRDAASPSHLAACASAAQAAFRTFSCTVTLAQRKEIVTKFADGLEAHKEALGREITEQMGRPVRYTPVEVATGARRARYLASLVDKVIEDTPGEPEEGFRRFVKKEPIGVVLVLFPWNYPYLTLINSIVPAILTGNAVIVKPSPQTPAIIEQVAHHFYQAGLPTNVLQYFHSGSSATIESLIRSPAINHICFTGSVAGGLGVQRAAAERVVGVGLELGGNDAAYVRPDVDLRWAAEEVIDGAIFNSGQSCCAIERVYVHESVYDGFIAAVRDVLAGYIVGDPFDEKTQIGPVISKRARETILAHVQDAVAKGARDETPANATFENMPPAGNFVKPTLLTGVTHDMAVMREETFGPIIPVAKVKDDEEAIRLINDSDLGLTASLWSKDMAKAEELAGEIEAGTVFVNRSDFPAPDLAWTGWKNSGRGVTLSKFGFDQFMKLKSYHLKNYPKA